MESYTISLKSFRSFRAPVFLKLVTGQKLFCCCFLQQMGSRQKNDNMDWTVLFLTNCFVNYFWSWFECWPCFFHPSISKCLSFAKTVYKIYLYGNYMPEFFLCSVQILNQSCALMRSQVQRGQILNELTLNFCITKYNSAICFLKLHT